MKCPLRRELHPPNQTADTLMSCAKGQTLFLCQISFSSHSWCPHGVLACLWFPSSPPGSTSCRPALIQQGAVKLKDCSLRLRPALRGGRRCPTCGQDPLPSSGWTPVGLAQRIELRSCCSKMVWLWCVGQVKDRVRTAAGSGITQQFSLLLPQRELPWHLNVSTVIPPPHLISGRR